MYNFDVDAHHKYKIKSIAKARLSFSHSPLRESFITTEGNHKALLIWWVQKVEITPGNKLA